MIVVSSLVVKYLIHVGIQTKQSTPMVTNAIMDRATDFSITQLNQAKEVFGNVISRDGNTYEVFSTYFKSKRYKKCNLIGNVDAIPNKDRIKMLIIDGDNPIILYYEPA